MQTFVTNIPLHSHRGRHQRPIIDADRLHNLGGMVVKIHSVTDTDHFAIIVASQMTVHTDQITVCRASIESTVGAGLQLHKERRVESQTTAAGKDELYLNVKRMRSGDAFDVQAIRTTAAGECHRTSGCLPCATVGENFVLDGGGFLLGRYMVQQRFVGTVHTVGMTVRGHLVRSEYRCSRKANRLLNGTVCTVWKVRRVLRGTSAAACVSELSVSVYLESGHLVRHTWADCPYVLHMSTQKDVRRLLDDLPPGQLGDEVDAMWKNSDEFHDRYVDARNDRLVDLRVFVRGDECGRVMVALMRDYVFCLLRARPSNVLEWTVAYFGGGADTLMDEENGLV